MNIFYPKNHYNKKFRVHVFPLLKPFFKNKTFTDEQRIQMYGVSERNYRFVDALEEACIVILPMSWDYYLKFNQVERAEVLLREAKKLNKKVRHIKERITKTL